MAARASACAGWFVDEFLLHYEPKQVALVDPRLLAGRVLMKIAFFLYVLLYTLMSEHAYLTYDLPRGYYRIMTSGRQINENVTLETGTGRYQQVCDPTSGIYAETTQKREGRHTAALECVFRDPTQALHVRSDGFFVVTRDRVEPQTLACTPPGPCNARWQWQPKPLDNPNMSNTFTVGVEQFRVALEHSVVASRFFLEDRQLNAGSEFFGSSLSMPGKMLRWDGTTMKRFTADGGVDGGGACNVDYVSAKQSKFDWFSVDELLEAAGFGQAGTSTQSAHDVFGFRDGLDARHDMPEACAEPYYTYRYHGAVFLVVITYSNICGYGTLRTCPMHYTMNVIHVPQSAASFFYSVPAEYTEFSDEVVTPENATRKKIKRSGIRFVLYQTGRIARFHFGTTVLNLIGALGLFSFSWHIVILLLPLVWPAFKAAQAAEGLPPRRVEAADLSAGHRNVTIDRGQLDEELLAVEAGADGARGASGLAEHPYESMGQARGSLPPGTDDKSRANADGRNMGKPRGSLPPGTDQREQSRASADDRNVGKARGSVSSGAEQQRGAGADSKGRKSARGSVPDDEASIHDD